MRKGYKRQFAALNCSNCGYQVATPSIATCPGCGCSFVPAVRSETPRRGIGRRIGWLSLPSMLYQTAYKWFVLFSAVDIILTWFILLLGGKEVNVLADAVIAGTGLKGILIYKFCLVMIVVLTCEVVGRRRPKLGRNLARGAVVLTSLPIIASIAQLLIF